MHKLQVISYETSFKYVLGLFVDVTGIKSYKELNVN